jgi:N-acetylglucosaminyl-diphospho-decaprenol L-rhamnosyltransferase
VSTQATFQSANDGPDCDAIIVNFRSPDLVESCVGSILDQGIVAADRIIVVENGSADDSADRLRASLPPRVKLLVSEQNGGFGAGVNLGMAAAEAAYVLVLNPDTRFVDGSFDKALALLRDDPTIGIVGLDLRNVDGSRQYSARRFYSLLDILIRRSSLKHARLFARRVKRHLMTESWHGAVFDTDWVMGTGFVIRRTAFNAVGGMDTGFFLYMEDVDLCRRVRDAGWRVVAAVDAVLVHDHQRASAAGPLSWSGRRHLTSLARYIRKHGISILTA